MRRDAMNLKQRSSFRRRKRPWNIYLKGIAVPVDIWHGLDDTIVRWKQADILADAILGAQRHFIADQGHFSNGVALSLQRAGLMALHLQPIQGQAHTRRRL
jgi:pimeloyl-ACP methyl ester carboxylesterase